MRTNRVFEKNHKDLVQIFHSLIPVAFTVIESLSGRKKLAENCSYLLLSKGINHTLSMFLLLERGLIIDACLSARNGIETFLMLELFATDSTEKYFKQWSNGKEFKPFWVRKQLGESLKAIVRDVEIIFDDDFYDSVKKAYSFFSGITHSNLKSSEYSIREKLDGHFEVPTGGVIEEKESLINCVFLVICGGLIRSLLITSAIFSTDLLDKIGTDVTKTQNKINKILSRIEDENKT